MTLHAALSWDTAWHRSCCPAQKRESPGPPLSRGTALCPLPLLPVALWAASVMLDAMFHSQETLRQHVDRVFTAITTSGVSCPTVMCDIFFCLREAAAKRFQGEVQGRMSDNHGHKEVAGTYMCE